STDPLLVKELTNSMDESNPGTLAAHIKTEVCSEDCGASEADFDPAGGADAASNGRLHTERSDTDDSGDYWREASGLWQPEESGETEGQSSEGRSCTGLSHQLPPVFSCKVCGEAFQQRTYLLTHTLAHLRDCGVCGKHLEHGETLKLHLRVHRESSFHCSVCGQRFTLRDNLRTHMRIHSGERPYSCTVCGKSFGRRATLVQHIRSHMGEKPLNTYFDFSPYMMLEIWHKRIF
uniref:C2H2-type domain-containing protein n=1 Tax=Monopterus albus TaxID=43700 RepID=A0A3Q3JTT9_MONAL